MSTQRLARANRSRFFIGLGILILTVGFVAIFHSSQQQIDELRQMELQCEQQQEVLNKRVQMYEKSIKSERLEHQRVKETKEIHDKSLMEANMKLGALQQNYKLLKSQNEDLIDEGDKLRANHLNEIAGLESKIRNAATISQQQLKQKDRELEELKVQYKQLNDKYKELKQQNLRSALEQELAKYREHCAWRPSESIARHSDSVVAPSNNVDSEQPPNNFNAQIPMIPKAVVQSSARFDKSTTTASGIRRDRVSNNLKTDDGIAELDNAPLPTAMRLSSVSTSRTTPLAAAVALATHPKKSRPVPEGVVPVPPDELLPEEQQQQQTSEVKTEGPPSDNNQLHADQTNNRYANIVDEAAAPGQEAAVAELPSDVDNGAREVLDNNDFLVDGGHKDHLQAVLDDVKLNSNNNINNNNNAAEDDAANGLDGQKQQQQRVAERDNQNDEDNAILNGVGVGIGNVDSDLPAAKSLKHKLVNDPKLRHEIDGDDGKVAGYPDDIHMEEPNNEDDVDDDEYENPSLRKLDPAVRN